MTLRRPDVFVAQESASGLLTPFVTCIFGCLRRYVRKPELFYLVSQVGVSECSGLSCCDKLIP
jgi:hypothetical protein